MVTLFALYVQLSWYNTLQIIPKSTNFRLRVRHANLGMLISKTETLKNIYEWLPYLRLW